MREYVFIHREQITQSGERRSFQVKVPDSAREITGISVTAFPFPGGIALPGAVFPNSFTVGDIHLAYPDSGDIFFTETVMFYPLNLSTESGMGVIESFDRPLKIMRRPRVQSLSILIPEKVPFIEGYYEDIFGDAGGAPTYQVNIYFYYKKCEQ